MEGLWILAVIFKWIGIALLAVLLLLLLAVLLLLFSPVSYQAEGKKEAAASGAFRVSWLLGAVRCRGGFTPENGLEIRLKLLWLTLLGGEPKAGKKKKRKEEPVPEELQPIAAREKPAEEPPKPQAAEARPEETAQRANAMRQENVSPQANTSQQAKTVRRVKLSEIAEPEEIPPEFPEDEAFFTGEEPAEEAKKKLPPIVSEIIHMEGKKEIFAALKKLLKRLLKGVLPGDFFLKGTFGTGDPASTGYLLAAAGVLKARFGSHIQIKGDFSKATAEDIEIRVKGRIVPAYLLWAALAFLLAKPVRRALWKLWKARK